MHPEVVGGLCGQGPECAHLGRSGFVLRADSDRMHASFGFAPAAGWKAALRTGNFGMHRKLSADDIAKLPVDPNGYFKRTMVAHHHNDARTALVGDFPEQLHDLTATMAVERGRDSLSPRSQPIAPGTSCPCPTSLT